MSKFLKFIVGIVLAVFIAAGAGLIIPQFLGIDVTVVQETTVSNQKVGTAVYSKKEDVSSLAAGQKILELDTNKLNVLTVTDYDADNSVITVTGGTGRTATVSRNYLRVLAAVPFIGFLSIATQSVTGLIVLAALLALIIIVFIIAEILKKGSDDYDEDEDEEPEEDDDTFYTDLAEKKRRSDREEEEKYNKKKHKKDSARKTKNSRADRHSGKRRPGDEDEDYTEEDEEKRSSSARKRPESEKARTKLQTEPDSGMTEISDSSAQGEEDLEPEEKEIGIDSLPDVQAALEAALENQPLNRTREDYTAQQPEKPDASQKEETEARDEIELAMPAHTAEELLEKAYADGLDPKLKKDETTGVTLVDYSDSL
ncbi:MAG TPA: hypothetical protein DCZ61_00125 [Lachnospiraceae bacterium]|nr:hypothetical protein [Lachnospiraceae bacterium]